MNINVTTTKVNIDDESLNKGEYNVRECNFTFSEEYEGLVCKALFTVTKTKLTYEQSIVNGKCSIPYEATVNRGKVIVGVIGYEVNGEELVKRYSPEADEFFVLDGSYVEDIENQSTPTPSELEQLEQRVSQVEIDAGQVEINTQDISDIKQEQTTQNNDILLRSLITETGSQIELSLNSTNFKMTATLKDKNGTVVNTSNEIDLPLESVVVNASYDSATKEIVLTLQNGNTVRFSVADLVSGLVSNTDYATDSKGGVIKKSSSYGTDITNQGVLIGYPIGYGTYQNINNYCLISKGTLENVITGKQLVNETQLDESQATQDDLIEALQTENSRIKATLPTTTGEGESITLSKTAELEFIQPPLPMGNSEQVQYSGKNLAKVSGSSIELMNNNTATVEKNGNDIIITGTMIGDSAGQKSFTIDGDKKENYPNYLVTNNTISLTAGTYILSINNISGNYSGLNAFKVRLVKKGTSTPYYIVGELTLPTTYVTINIAEDGEYFIVPNMLYTSETSITFNNYKFNIMLAKGTDTAYEPYVGGTASPNPSYPQAITNVTGDVEVLVQNKNLFATSKMQNGFIPENGSYPTQSSSYPNAKYILIPLKANQSISVSGSTANMGRARCIDITTNKAVRAVTTTTNDYFTSTSSFASGFTEGTITAKQDIIIGFMTLQDVDLSSFQIEYNTTATTYTPHKEQTFTFPLGTQRLMLGDYLADDGIHHVRGKVEYDGSSDEIWDIQSNAYFRSGSIQDIATSTSNSKCTIATITTLSNLSSSDVNKYAVGGNRLWFRCPQFETLADWKAYLAENPITVEYELAEEEITPYTTEQQAVYNQIKQAISYEEQTNISGSSDESNPLFSVEAYQSIKLVLVNLN